MIYTDESPPAPIRQAVDQLNRMVSEDPNLCGAIPAVFDRYLADTLWPTNFREMEKALDRLDENLATIFRTLLISTIDLFEDWRDDMPTEIRDYLKDIQERYAYRYRVAAYKTVFSGDASAWYSAIVHTSSRNNQPHYGISIVRNDGEHLYFEGREESMRKLIDVIETAMSRPGDQED